MAKAIFRRASFGPEVHPQMTMRPCDTKVYPDHAGNSQTNCAIPVREVPRRADRLLLLKTTLRRDVGQRVWRMQQERPPLPQLML